MSFQYKKRPKATAVLLIAMVTIITLFQNCGDIRIKGMDKSQPQLAVIVPEKPPVILPPIEDPPFPTPSPIPSPEPPTAELSSSPNIKSGSATNVQDTDFAYKGVMYTGKYFLLLGDCSDKGTVRFGPGQWDYYSGRNGGGLYAFDKTGNKKVRANICWDASQNGIDQLLTSWGVTDQYQINLVKRNVGNSWDHDWGGARTAVAITSDKVAILAGGPGNGGEGTYRGILLYQISELANGLSISLIRNYPLISSSNTQLIWSHNRLSVIGSSYRAQLSSEYRGEYIWVFDENLNLISQTLLDPSDIRKQSHLFHNDTFWVQVQHSGIYRFLSPLLDFIRISNTPPMPHAGFTDIKDYGNQIIYRDTNNGVIYRDSGDPTNPIEHFMTLRSPRPLSSEHATLERGASVAGPYGVIGPFVWRNGLGPAEIHHVRYPNESETSSFDQSILGSAVSEDGYVAIMNIQRINFFRIK